MNSRPITSAANPTVKMLKSLAVKKYREEEGLFLVEGARHIQDALSGGFTLIFAAYSPRAGADKSVCATANDILEVDDDILSRITGRDNPQAVIGAFRLPQTTLPAATANGLWVGLEGVRDPGNLGTIIRTADAAGAAGIILIGSCCDPWQPESVRGSMGSFARVKIAAAPLADFLTWRKNWPGAVIGTHLRHDAADYRAQSYKLPLLLLMGGESNGLSDNAVAACDSLVKIPMLGGTESLNLAVSTALMLYEIQRPTLK